VVFDLTKIPPVLVKDREVMFGMNPKAYNIRIGVAAKNTPARA
jgi:hypothetical protein